MIALGIALKTAYETMTNSEILLQCIGHALAITIAIASFGYAYNAEKKFLMLGRKENKKDASLVTKILKND